MSRKFVGLFGIVLLVLNPPPFERTALGALPKVQDGFRIRLVASVPAVHYPCQVATAPDGSLFVAEDPMDQLGPYESDNGRIILFRDGKSPVVFAEGFRAIFGMAWRDGALYVMHMPRMTVLRDRDGDGKADERSDLFKDLGPGPKALNDHIVSGLQFGMDGWLYISVGDKGVPGATGPDGRKVQLKGGGTLRCRPDGTRLEVYSRGTRNHLEPNLDDRDNLFTYDNTDDGDGWWTRVTHHVDGGYYGYPYDYHDRPDRHLPRMAEYGGGSPCGAVFYKEDAWPAEYRGMGLWAEWGKRAVRAIRFKPNGSTFEVGELINLVEPGEVSDFRPIDLALSHDGKTLYIADWSMGGWGSKTEKVGRIYALTWAGKALPEPRPRGNDGDPIPQQIKQLDHPSFNERMRAQAALIRKGELALPTLVGALKDEHLDPVARRHILWAIDGIAGGTPGATFPIVGQLKSPVPDLRAQAARALGEREAVIAAEPLSALVNDPDPTVRLQVTIALGRMGLAQSVPALLPLLADSDRYIAYSAQVALRRINDWKVAGAGLSSSNPKVRQGVLAALDQVYESDGVDVLRAYISNPKAPADERALALNALAQVHRKTAPWDGSWWGTRPSRGTPPAKSVDWPQTAVIGETIRRSLGDESLPIRRAAIQAARVADDRALIGLLRERFSVEPSEELKREIVQVLGKSGDREAIPLLVSALRDSRTPSPIRDAALASVELIGGTSAIRALTGLLETGEIGDDRLPPVISALGRFKAKEAVAPLLSKLSSPSIRIRVAALVAIGQIKPGESTPARSKVRPLLKDRSVEVRKAAIGAIGALQDRGAIPDLIAAAGEEPTRFEATLALGAMPDPRALQVYLHGLAERSQEVRKASSNAILTFRDLAAPSLQRLADRKELPPSALPELRKIFSALQPIMTWKGIGPFKLRERPPFATDQPVDLKAKIKLQDGKELSWTPLQSKDEGGAVELSSAFSSVDNISAFAYGEFTSATRRQGILSVGSDDTLTVWLNGKQVYKFDDSRGYTPEAGRAEVTFEKGVNRVLVRCGNHGGGWMFSVAFSNPSEYAFLKGPSPGAFNPETFRAFAQKTSGDAGRGQALFSDLKGVACVKCHAVGAKGGTVGPDLAGIAARYTKDELIASVLYPSAKIFSGYEPIVLALGDGRTLTGILKGETADSLEIEDAESKRIKIAKSEIEERKVSDVSLMPNGLAEGLTARDFADLIAYLTTLREPPPVAPRPAPGNPTPHVPTSVPSAPGPKNP